MAKMKIYCAGGTGINIGRNFIKYAGKTNPGFADIETIFIDTSKSNMDTAIPREMVYLVDDLDGSGKLRASNYAALNECSKEILHTHKPADLNIVLHSGSGGTGSVIGPILVSEMLARGETVIVIVVGSTSSRIETENTAKTLKSYEVISAKREMPVIATYKENSSAAPRSSVDSEIQTTLVLLAAVFSGQNRELDMSDLRNFLAYNRVTSYQPKLALLDFFSKDIVLGRGQAVATLVTLVDENTSSEVDIPIEYQAVGFLPENTKKDVSVPLPIHGCVITGYFNGVIERLNAKLASYDDARAVVVEKRIVDPGSKSTDDGLIL